MAKETKNMRAPLTLDGSGDPGEMTFASDQAAPFATTDPNVWQIAPVDKSEEIEEYWQFMGRITGTGAADQTIDCVLWFYNAFSEEFYPSTKIRFVGANELTLGFGNVIQIPGVFGTTHVGISFTGLVGDQNLHVVHSWR